jgi:hypothetical protein
MAMKTTRSKASIAFILLLVSVCSARAQQVNQEFIPDYDYRIVQKQWPDGHWTTGVHKVLYYPNTEKEMIFDVSEFPAIVAGSSKKDVKRELRLFAQAAERPMLVFPLVGPQGGGLQ